MTKFEIEPIPGELLAIGERPRRTALNRFFGEPVSLERTERYNARMVELATAAHERVSTISLIGRAAAGSDFVEPSVLVGFEDPAAGEGDITKVIFSGGNSNGQGYSVHIWRGNDAYLWCPNLISNYTFEHFCRHSGIGSGATLEHYDRAVGGAVDAVQAVAKNLLPISFVWQVSAQAGEL